MNKNKTRTDSQWLLSCSRSSIKVRFSLKEQQKDQDQLQQGQQLTFTLTFILYKASSFLLFIGSLTLCLPMPPPYHEPEWNAWTRPLRYLLHRVFRIVEHGLKDEKGPLQLLVHENGLILLTAFGEYLNGAQSYLISLKIRCGYGLRKEKSMFWNYRR